MKCGDVSTNNNVESQHGLAFLVFMEITIKREWISLRDGRDDITFS